MASLFSQLFPSSWESGFVEKIKAAHYAEKAVLDIVLQMIPLPHRGHFVLNLTLGALLVGVSGCLSCLNPVSPPDAALVEPCHELPKYCRDHVYVFFLNGIDPVNYGNLTGIREYVESLGFRKTYYGQLYHASYFADEIERIHKEESDAHFVLVGFGRGTRKIRAVAERVQSSGVSIDLLVYLDAKLPPEVGSEAGPVLGYFQEGQLVDVSDSQTRQNLWLFGNPTSRRTVELVGQELVHIASKIPPVEPAQPEVLPFPNEEPTPKPVKRQVPSRNGEWDFLKPSPDRVHLQHEGQAATGGFSG